MRFVHSALVLLAISAPLDHVAAQETTAAVAQNRAPSFLVIAERAGASATVRRTDGRLVLTGDSLVVTATMVPAGDSLADLIFEAATPTDNVVLIYTPHGATDHVRIVASRITVTREVGSQELRVHAEGFRLP